LLIGRVRRVACRIARGRDMDALTQFPELPLGAPEATHAEHGGLEARRVRPFERMVVDEMVSGRWNGCRTARQGIGGRRYFGLLPQVKHRTLSRGSRHHISSVIYASVRRCAGPRPITFQPDDE